MRARLVCSFLVAVDPSLSGRKQEGCEGANAITDILDSGWWGRVRLVARGAAGGAGNRWERPVQREKVERVCARTALGRRCAWREGCRGRAIDAPSEGRGHIRAYHYASS